MFFLVSLGSLALKGIMFRTELAPLDKLLMETDFCLASLLSARRRKIAGVAMTLAKKIKTGKRSREVMGFPWKSTPVKNLLGKNEVKSCRTSRS